MMCAMYSVGARSKRRRKGVLLEAVRSLSQVVLLRKGGVTDVLRPRRHYRRKGCPTARPICIGDGALTALNPPIVMLQPTTAFCPLSSLPMSSRWRTMFGINRARTSRHGGGYVMEQDSGKGNICDLTH